MNSLKTKRLLAALAVAAAGAAAVAQVQDDPFPPPPKQWPGPVNDQQKFAFLLVDRLEYGAQPGPNARAWDSQGWVGGDMNKFWFKTEGEDEPGRGIERAELQLLYARRVSPFWYVQAGARREGRRGSWSNGGVLGVQGLAPYWFQTEAMLFVERKGVAARLEFETDLLATQRLILQPRFETQVSGFTDRERGVGRGLQHVEIGMRLRYEIRREFAPYVGVVWTRRFGETASIARDEGNAVRGIGVVAGLRVWY
jgi:copper resistance protein B